MKNPPKIALTMGDPAGIGPELAVRAATSTALRKIAELCGTANFAMMHSSENS